MSLFEDRAEAGKKLSDFIGKRAEFDLVVVPYGEAFDIGSELARDNEAKIEQVKSEFISASDTPYAEVGAVAEDGTIWLEDGLVDEMDISRSYIESSAKSISSELGTGSKELEIEEDDRKMEKVLLVSEGLGSGFREAAVAGSLLKKGFKEIYIATPVKSKNVMADLEAVVDEVFYMEEVAFLSSSDCCYAAK